MLKSGRPSSDGFGSGRPTSTGGWPASVARELGQPRPSSARRSRAQQQIARQVADERELRRDGEVGAARPPRRGARQSTRALPARSPTVGLICSSAIFTAFTVRSHFSLT